MKFFERLIGRPKEAEAAREVVRALSEEVGVDSIRVTPDLLQRVVAQGGLTSEQEARLLKLANRPEIKEQLPPVVYPELNPVEPLPDRKILEKELEPLSDQEMQKALEAFGQDLKSGRLPVFAMGNVSGEQSVRLSRENLHVLPEHLRQAVERDPKVPVFQKLGRLGGEHPVWMDNLAPGYERARDYFGQTTYELLMQKPGWAFPEGKYVHRGSLGASKHFEEDLHAVNTTAEKRRFRTVVRDVYLPRQTMYEQALTEARVEIDAEIDARQQKLVRTVDHAVEGVKAVEVTISDSTAVIGDPRASYLSIFILLGPSNKLRKGLREGEDVGNWRTYLRALRTNPGFFLEALRKNTPEVFESGTGRKYYGEEGKAWEPDIMTMHLDVPELRAVGEPDTRTFWKMG